MRREWKASTDKTKNITHRFKAPGREKQQDRDEAIKPGHNTVLDTSVLRFGGQRVTVEKVHL